MLPEHYREVGGSMRRNRPSGSVVVRQGPKRLCSVAPGRQLSFGRLPAFLPAASRKGKEVVWFQGSGSSRLELSKGALEVPPSSPFSPLGFGGGLRVGLYAFKLLVYGPRHLGRC